ncbi:MAG: NOP58 family protein [Thermoplasmata archaeon]|nr:MAG: NOP58 family protein [Thermoplasmata archaeon]
MYLKTRWFGVFLYDDEKIIEANLFPKDANEIFLRLYKIQNGELLDEEKEFKKYEPVVDEKRLRQIGKIGKVKDIELKAVDYGYPLALLKDACIKLAEKKIKEKEEKRENRISQAINALDEIIKIENIVGERLSDWYGFFGEYESEKDVLNLKINGEEIDRMEEETIKKLAEILSNLREARKKLEKYIEKAMEEIAPNVTGVVGYKIAARLLMAAGSIAKLASMPAGTIQLLGAEKALFRHLKDGSNPPKHGYIFMHELVRKAPKGKRGKIARLLATKISIAAKADAFTHNNIVDALVKEVEKRYDEIMREKEKKYI